MRSKKGAAVKNLEPVIVIIEDSEEEEEKAEVPLTNLTNKVPAQKDASNNRATCHQCRQKTSDVVVRCSGAVCRLKFCSKCLDNRYGEKRDEMTNLDTWICPRCRGICNCSLCMKKKGCSPTGGMARLAKANGFESVAEYLNVAKEDSPETNERNVDKNANKNAKLNHSVVQSTTNEKKIRGKNRLRGKECPAQVVEPSEESSKKAGSSNDKPEASVKMKKLSSISELDATKKRKRKDKLDSVQNETNQATLPTNQSDAQKSQQSTQFSEREILGSDEWIDLPAGVALVSVTGLQLPGIAIGPALQMLEFCSAFQEMLHLRLNHGEAVLQEMVTGVSTRTSPLAQLHVKLLSILFEDLNEESKVTPTTWVTSLLHYLSHVSSFPSSSNHFKDLENGVQGYDRLEVPIKIRLLNTLSDDCLCLRRFREYIEGFPGVAKENQDAVTARKKAKGVAKAAFKRKQKALLTLQESSELSAKQRQKLIDKVRLEAQIMNAAQSDISNILVKSARRDAVRTEPIIAVSGRFCWRLKGVDDRMVTVVQGAPDPTSAQETWTKYTDEQEEMLLKFMAAERLKTHQGPDSNSGRQTVHA